MNGETIDAGLRTADEELRLEREKEEAARAHKAAREERATKVLESQRAVSRGFEAFVRACAPHDFFTPVNPDDYRTTQAREVANQDRAKLTVVLARDKEMPELGRGKVTASVSLSDMSDGHRRPVRFGDLGSGYAACEISVEFVATQRSADGLMSNSVVPLPAAGERFGLSPEMLAARAASFPYGVPKAPEGPEQDPLAVLESIQAAESAQADATQAYLWSCARNPVLNPELAIRLAQRFPLPEAV